MISRILASFSSPLRPWRKPHPPTESALSGSKTHSESRNQFHPQLRITETRFLLESTGAGCVWFDYNNDGRPISTLSTAKPLDDGIHPYPLKTSRLRAAQSSVSQRSATATSLTLRTSPALAPDMYGIAVSRPTYDNDGFVDLLVTGYGKRHSLPQRRQRHFYRCDSEGRDQGRWLVHQLHLARLRQRWMRRSLRRTLCEVRSEYRTSMPPITIPGRSIMKARPISFITTTAMERLPM